MILLKDTSPTAAPRWVEGAIVYQIYPRSFQDSNNDGIGDLPGIIDRLDYLSELGVTAIWLSPFYPSPMADFGYDVADYCAVHPTFGTLDDFDRIQAAAAKRNIKVIIDLVPNHTSDEHEWFVQSRASGANQYSDWYIWKDAAGIDDTGKPIPPNNWLNVLTGQSAWQWEETRNQFYLHSFDIRQPDLNWENPAVREAIRDAMRFWLDRGVDGFRVDAVNWIAKDPEFHDDPPNPTFIAGQTPPYHALLHENSCAWPQMFDYLSEMADVLKEDAYTAKPRFMVTEAYPEQQAPIPSYMAFYHKLDPTVAAPFNFEGISLPWQAEPWRYFLDDFHKTLHAYDSRAVASYAFGNHDQPRLVSRIGEAAARSAAVMLLTLPGMAFIYNGEEIGMHDVVIPADQVRDPAALGDTTKGQGRDPERTPMQWSAAKNAGFSDADTTWLPLAADYETRNTEYQAVQTDSFLSLYRRLCRLRTAHDALKRGGITIYDSAPDTLVYSRQQLEECFVVAVNFTDHDVMCAVPVTLSDPRLVETSGQGSADLQADGIRLSPHAAAIIQGALPATQP